MTEREKPYDTIVQEFDIEKADVDDCKADIASVAWGYCDRHDVEPDDEFVSLVQRKMLGLCLDTMRSMRDDPSTDGSRLDYAEPEDHFDVLSSEMADGDTPAVTNISFVVGTLASENETAQTLANRTMAEKYGGDDE